MPQSVDNQIFRMLSGDRAKALTAEITQFHRPPGATGYHAATSLVAERLREAGVTDIETVSYPLDGTTMVGEAPLPMAWEPYGATVRVVSPVQQDVVDLETTSSCLAWWSQPTPPGGVTAELVDVGTGETDADYEGKDLTGKIALIEHTLRTGGWMHAAAEAIRRGACGILSDYLLYTFEPHRTREALPDAVQLLRLPNQLGKHNVWACSISRTTAQRLRDLLRLGPVTLHADIRCKLFSGHGQNLMATIEGRESKDEAVFFVAHTSAATCPCANCAAGPALMVEIARTLNKLIEAGHVERPRRSIKFLFVIEMLGSRVFIDRNPDSLNSVRTAIFFDSVGHDQGKLKSSLMFYRHPDSSPSFINDYFATIMERVPKDASWVYTNDTNVSPVQFQQAPYTPWSDNHVWARYGVPSPLIMSWPDMYFHTQFLTADNTDPRVFRRAGVTSTIAAYEIANAGPADALAIAADVAARSRFRLETMVTEAVRRVATMRQSGDSLSDDRRQAVSRARRRLRYAAERDATAIASTLALAGQDHSSLLKTEVDSLVDGLERQYHESVERLERAVSAMTTEGWA